ncbi:Hypothetical predicted protein [Cloeon dipterum]|uniref:Large ribosomal subunit protein uL10 n=1 Tax=Cloeon dipterum TaxID=197152 RepID=A0A8S1DEX5_9INSE|nr:Hypothetical predicted protein [Cloeon dipterum]
MDTEKELSPKTIWKQNYFAKLQNLMTNYDKFFIVNVDNVGSKQIQDIRQSLRDCAHILMGKNTLIRKGIRILNDPSEMDKRGPQKKGSRRKGTSNKNTSEHKQSHPIEKILPHIRGNVGFVFTNQELREVRDKLVANKRKAPARAGAISPCSVVIPAHNTKIGPEKTSFFQKLSIPTKISKGTIEIIHDVHILKENDRVGASEAALLNMLGISPFSFGLEIQMIYDCGAVYEPEVLDLKPEDIRARFTKGVSNFASLCLSISYPSMASAPHIVVNGFTNLVALTKSTGITFKQATAVLALLEGRYNMAAAVPDTQPAVKEEEKVNVEEEEEEDDIIFPIWNIPD